MVGVRVRVGVRFGIRVMGIRMMVGVRVKLGFESFRITGSACTRLSARIILYGRVIEGGIVSSTWTKVQVISNICTVCGWPASAADHRTPSCSSSSISITASAY